MRARVLLAGLFHETHTFLEGTTPLEAFQLRLDEELLTARNDGSPLDGFLETAEQHDWDVIPTVDMRATPSATVEDAVVETFWELLRARVVVAMEQSLDAIYLVLHGAMVSESLVDVEGELLERLRRLLSPTHLPIFGVFDLHANVSERMAYHADALVAYREHPHTDARESAVRAAKLLGRALQSGTTPQMYLRHPPIMWPPTGTGTHDRPMAALESLARQQERENSAFWEVSVAAGFSFADTPDTGVSFLIVSTATRATTEQALDQLEALALAEREKGNTLEPPAEDILDRILPVRNGPVILAEPSDNIGGGAPGDGTGLLRALLARNVPSALAIINDPEAVARVRGLAPGERLEIPLGGKGSKLDPGPVTLEVELVSTSDGRFTLEDPHSHLASMTGLQVDMGPCAVVRHAGVTLLLTSRKTPPFDLGQLRSQGIEPTLFQIIVVKAAVAYRQAYNPIAKVHYSVETPGPCSSDLQTFPYERVRRPIYPLDPLST